MAGNLKWKQDKGENPEKEKEDKDAFYCPHCHVKIDHVYEYGTWTADSGGTYSCDYDLLSGSQDNYEYDTEDESEREDEFERYECPECGANITDEVEMFTRHSR